MKISVTLEATLTVEFDENSEDFKELYNQYTQSIHRCDYEGFAEDICSHIARYGADDFIEGVGNVQINGNKQFDYLEMEELECPINVRGDFDLNNKCDFEMPYTEIYNL